MQNLSEVLGRVSQLATEAERVAYLQRLEPRYVKPVKIVLEYMFDPRRKFLLPPGAPPYKPSAEIYPGQLYSDLRKLYLFVEGGNPNLKQFRREILFGHILEAVDPPDAQLLLAIKDKKSPYAGLTKEVAAKAFPDLGL